MARELEDAILSMRTNELDIGTWLIKTEGDSPPCWRWTPRCWRTRATGWCARPSACCAAPSAAWTCRSRSLFALIEPGSCFAGTCSSWRWPATAATCWRCPTTPARRRRSPSATCQLRPVPDGHRPEPPGRRFYDEQPALDAVREKAGQPLDADAAFALGLVTSNPDDIDWADEVRIAIEERVAMSPDALTGMEANLRFNGPENMFTRVFGRLTAWQNWIFQRPNAVGEKGALKVYGKGDKAAFDWNRV
jgi:benzoyl-CoA-dihydrodiol lyase